MPTQEYGVIMGSDMAVQEAGVCKRIPLLLQNVKIMEDFLWNM